MDEHTPLNVFLTVVTERSFTRAADRLLRTQPAISLAIQRLEQDLGERLLDRTGRDIALTDAGQLVYDCARRQSNLFRELQEQLQELRDLSMGRLIIGANESMTLYLLPHLSEFRRRYPKIKLVVKRSRSSELTDRLLAGDVDFAVLSFRPEDARFDSLDLYSDHLSFIVPPQHRLATRRSISIRDLGMETFVAHNVTSPYRDTVIQAFRTHQVPLQMDIEMPTVEGVRRMVQAGEGVAFLPHLCVEQDLQQGVLREVRVKELQVARKIRLVRLAKRPLSHAAGAFQDMIRAPKRRA